MAIHARSDNQSAMPVSNVANQIEEREARGDQEPAIMRRHFALTFIGAILAATQIASAQPLYPCEAPIEFQIGALDPRFGISRGDFRHAIEQAGDVWGTAANRKLFKYEETGELKINLVYDARQQTTQSENIAVSRIMETMKGADSIKDELVPLKDNAHALQEAYSSELASYKRALDSYNQEVEHWNGVGGAPDSENQRLVKERLSLRKQGELLETKRQRVNQLSDEINALVERHNSLVDRANADVSRLNVDGLAGTQFEEGLYVKEGDEEHIDIFQFKNRANLLLVLAHELGHALGLGHNRNPNSIMSPLIQAENLVLSADDVKDLKDKCLPR
jgi:hypothetical protein